MKILIVDDNVDDRNILRYVLQAHGHDVVEAFNGKDALQKAPVYMPDLIISDALMPIMDGFQFLRKLRGTSPVPFIFYSAVYDGPGDMQLASSLGADGYIIKPKDSAELIEEIERITGKRPRERPLVIEEDSLYLKRYSQVVASKLEQKVKKLEETVTECKLAEHALLEKQQRLSDMTVELSLAEDRERRRIATTLHDSIGQDLALARIKLGMLAKASLSGKEAKILDDAREIIDATIKSVRSITHRISPPILENAGLEAALKWLGRQMESDYNLHVLFTDDLSEKSASKDVNAELYYAARELLINVAKHAETGSARISISRADNCIVITVEDNGIGFHPDTIEENSAREGGGFGHFNIRRRIIYLGGSFEVDSSPGTGTRVTIRMPLKTSILP
ncbi:MAG: response regulator [Desulfuromonadaceae bacterium]|nr:response regulator [Desulfuromonadaceae bacterium]MDD5105247.1 response regulator [Desulfuromonadaceae bacterium]